MNNTIDLSDSSLNSYWNKIDKGIHSILESLEKNEDWVLDNKDNISESIELWAKNLTNEKADGYCDNPDKLFVLLGLIKSKKAFYLIKILEELAPNITVDLLYESLDRIEDNPDSRFESVFRDRIIALYRVDLLSRIFSLDRMKEIKNVVNETVSTAGGLYEE